VLLHTWRNDPVVRSLSRSTAPIPLDMHATWLRSSLASSDRHLLVVETAGDATPTATVRYDLLPSEDASRERWEVSITVAPDLRGRGLGLAALSSSDAWLVAREPEASEIVAYVRRSHLGSLRLFGRNGYRPIASDDPELECLVRRLRQPVSPPVSRTP
jgi:RimJ/RimL family protein N-acetyltransferase